MTTSFEVVILILGTGEIRTGASAIQGVAILIEALTSFPAVCYYPPMGDIHRRHPKGSKEISNRLSRCEGHLRSIRAMVEEGRSCESLFVQLAAVKSALHEASLKIYESHLDHCLSAQKISGSKNRELRFISKLMLKGSV